MKKDRIRVIAVVVAYLLAAVWFFCPIGEPEDRNLLFAMRLALPAIVLTAGGIWLLPKLMMVGFCFCAIGDAMGVIGSFEGQMGGFAVAHICFISYFYRGIHWQKAHPAMLVTTTLLCLIPLGLAAQKVIPAITALPIRIGCSVYALLLTGTVWTSITRKYAAPADKTDYSFATVAGSLLFLASDFILAWNKFVEHIPHASIYIMTTYYAALLMLFAGSLTVKRDV